VRAVAETSRDESRSASWTSSHRGVVNQNACCIGCFDQLYGFGFPFFGFRHVSLDGDPVAPAVVISSSDPW
jgi:hypothetical protein